MLTPDRSHDAFPSSERTTEGAVRVGVCADGSDESLHAKSRALAEELKLPVVTADESDCDLLLVVTPKGLELRETGPRAAGGVEVDFGSTSAGARRLAGASRGDPLARAVGLKHGPPTVVDATAGLGRDAMTLACLGCTVTAIERSPILAAMWRDALARATAIPVREAIDAGRIRLITGDAIDLLNRMPTHEAPDVVYLDPMYTPRGKSGLPKKEMRILRRLVGDDPDAASLLQTARRTARHRTVVKRNPRAQPLAPDPTIQYTTKLVRYDVYLRQNGAGLKRTRSESRGDPSCT